MTDTAGARGFDPAQILNQLRPWMYAFWLDGNVTKQGITADLEAMRDAGIGGFLFMDGSLGMPPGPYRFMSSAWQEQFRHMAAEACRLSLGINLNNGAGWAGSGGPWVSPEFASQVVVHSQLTLQGPSRYDAVVPLPVGIRHGYYRDIAILAYRLTGEAPGYRIKNFNSTKSFAGAMDFEDVVPWPRFIPTSPEWPALAPEEMLDESTLQDLGPRLQAGRLRWNVPAGKWLILRFGHTVSNGATRMTQPEASGLETDKLSRAAVQRHFAAYVAKLAPLGACRDGNVIVSTHIDSWEAGSGNWTAGFREEFRRRRGYDLLPYLATLAGFVVGSIERSERFLWDLRETVAELLLQNYAEEMSKLAHAQGMRLSIEGYDGTCDDLRYSGRADEPMG
ncbi:MAG TPA: glycosyl hydrolase, partial [Tepidisphaeraceae bacterium]|nr:glycosyl hydrolase [Tepidisphaeraceae bacterium]